MASVSFRYLVFTLQIAVCLSTPLWKDVCTQVETKSLPFCDTALNIPIRVADYVGRVPIDRQIAMMGNMAAGFDELNIPPYQWWSEGLHGPLEPCVQYGEMCACPTSFPSPSAMGNAFNETLYRMVGNAIGQEGRAISNVRLHDTSVGDGLTYWSPTINLQRDPRWGRNQEVPGEDPYLTSRYAEAFVSALQSGDETEEGDDGYGKIRIGAACKHFVANSLEKWGNWSRHNFDAHIDDEDLHNYYFPPFTACAKHAVGVMCSYNAINGQPACANPWLLQDILRTKMNFSGYLVTDCDALADIVVAHHYAVDATQASAMAKNATVDVNCGDGDYFPSGLLKAYDEGWVEKSTISASFARMATVQFRLGLFDSDSKADNPMEDMALIGSQQHAELAYEAAKQSIVLLQNKNNLLPLDPMKKLNLAVIGPHIHATRALLSNYYGDRCGCEVDDKRKINDLTTRDGPDGIEGADNDDEDETLRAMDCIETPLQAIVKRMHNPEYTIHALMGCTVGGTEINELEEAADLAMKSDAVVLLLGLDSSQEAEELDRYETTLPGLQAKLLAGVLEVAADKTIVVLIHGGIVSLGTDALSKAEAILTAGYGGQAGSAALASVLFGDYNPTGKLATTWYPPSFVTDLPMTEMGLRVGVGRTHLFYQGTPEFPFGHGLSYSQWRLHWHSNDDDVVPAMGSLAVDRTILVADESIKILVAVENLGPHFDGAQTILLFWSPKDVRNNESSKSMVRQKLIGFAGTAGPVIVGAKDVVEFDVQWADFALWNAATNSSTVNAGTYELRVQGPSSASSYCDGSDSCFDTSLLTLLVDVLSSDDPTSPPVRGYGETATA